MDEASSKAKTRESQLLCLRAKTLPIMPAQTNVDRDLLVS